MDPSTLTDTLRRLNTALAGDDPVARSDALELASAQFDAHQHLIVYGSLAPGRDNHHIVGTLRGEWSGGWITGELVPSGWGSHLGFPAFQWRTDGRRIEAWLLSSADLPGAWDGLDAFEGPGYLRLLTPFEALDGTTSVGFVYTALTEP